MLEFQYVGDNPGAGSVRYSVFDGDTWIAGFATRDQLMIYLKATGRDFVEV